MRGVNFKKIINNFLLIASVSCYDFYYMINNLDTPILFLIFNRPEATKLVFEQIKKAKPRQLFIAADGPRAIKTGEFEICEAARLVVMDGIDWDCEVKTLFRAENLGCGKAVSEAISWFFNHVEAGIILEDDCLPDNSFFAYCATLLELYRNETNIMSVSGTNFLGTWKEIEQSYFFGHGGIWGWATWRRAWLLYDKPMKEWPLEITKKQIRNAIQTEQWYNYYYPMFQSAFDETLDTWDAQWFYTILLNDGICINPSVNLVKNIGFNKEGTHTTNSSKLISNLPTTCLQFPLKPPITKSMDIQYLDLIFKKLKSDDKRYSFWRKLFNGTKRLISKF